MDSKNFFLNRFYFLISTALVLTLILGLRLFQKQVLEHRELAALAKHQYIDEKTVPSQRGKIYISDYYGEKTYLPIATNITFYSLWVVPKDIQDPKEVAEKLAPFLELSKNEIFQKINNDKAYIPPLEDKLSQKTAKKIQDLNLQGVLLVPGLYRYYPEGVLASHILGYVDRDGNGQYGVESYYDNELRGKVSKFYTSKNSFGNYVDILGQNQTNKGDNLYLTIDRNIQFIVEEKLENAVKQMGAKNGSVIVMDPNSGAIIAMANYPNFDPNKFNIVKSMENFNNLAVSSIYEPGSVFKPFVVAAALQENKIETDTSGVFPACIKIGSYTICTSTGEAYGRETIGQIIEHSDNVGMVFVGQKLGKENLNK